MKEFKARCSRLGDLFTNPRSKSETISETTKTYLEEWYLEQWSGVKKEINSMYLSKGIDCEEESIKIYADMFGVDAIKNEEWFENDFITGTPDIILEDKVVDIKNCFTPFTFPKLKTELPNKAYFYQLQGYMYLTGKKEAEIAYFLLDNPDDVILAEAKKIMYKEELSNDWLDVIVEEVRANRTYEHIPLKERVKIFKVERDEDVIKEISERVINCRKYLENH